MTNEPNWLEAEMNGDDALAEAIFARAIAEIPAVTPRADFVHRTVQVAWRVRPRRVVERLAGVAAALTIGIVGLATLYETSARVMTVAVRGVVLSSHALVWVLTWTSKQARWWWIGERIGAAVGGAVVGRSAAGAIVVAEIIILLSIYALQRLVPGEAEVRESRKA